MTGHGIFAGAASDADYELGEEYELTIMEAGGVIRIIPIHLSKTYSPTKELRTYSSKAEFKRDWK
jgi:hypothetical protein